jgi:hypothetical protein
MTHQEWRTAVIINVLANAAVLMSFQIIDDHWRPRGGMPFARQRRSSRG